MAKKKSASMAALDKMRKRHDDLKGKYQEVIRENDFLRNKVLYNRENFDRIFSDLHKIKAAVYLKGKK